MSDFLVGAFCGALCAVLGFFAGYYCGLVRKRRILP